MDKKRVLFICTGNACRSQMAEGWLRHIAGGEFEVHSAGTHPWMVHPLAVEVMSECDVDISEHRSKGIAEFLDRQFDYVITTCDRASETCPALPGHHEHIHWSIDDPIFAQGDREPRLREFRRIRDEITERIDNFVSQVQGSGGAIGD